MTAPAPVVTADDTEARMAYFLAVVEVLRATTRPAVRPVISRAEYAAMLTSFSMGLTAAGFAARLSNADRARRIA